MANRTQLAERIAFGLGGWFQTLASQSIHNQAGEDAAKLMAIQILNAQNAYVPEASARPTNWGNARQRIDIAIKGRNPSAQGWYGAAEIKWPGEAVDLDQTRDAIVQDALRMAFVATANLCANLLVMGGSSDALRTLFDQSHPRAHASEGKRKSLGQLLSRDLDKPDGMLTTAKLLSDFPDYAKRVPPLVFKSFNGRLRTTLLARCTVHLGTTDVGYVYVWHCKRTRGGQVGPQSETPQQKPDSTTTDSPGNQPNGQ